MTPSGFYESPDHALHLNANSSTGALGAYRIFKVNKGDELTATVKARYISTGSTYADNSINTTSIGSSYGLDGTTFHSTGAGISAPEVAPPTSQHPNAYLRILLVDEDGNELSGDNGETAHIGTLHKDLMDGLSITQEITTPCYAIVYVANESPADVYFDDLELEHKQLIVQENNYYPFGMDMVGTGYTEDEDKRHGYGYNGKEEISSFDLNWQDYGARNYDSQLGRMHSIDPLGEVLAGASPYSYVLNNPITFTDPTGMFPELPNGSSSDQEKPSDFDTGSRCIGCAGPAGSTHQRIELQRFFPEESMDMNSSAQNPPPDSSIPRYFDSEQDAIKFMMEVSFQDKTPDDDDNVSSPETSAWILYDEKNDKTIIAVMPWDTKGKYPNGKRNNYKNTNHSSNNTFFRVYSTKKNPKIYINSSSYKVIGHIHMHPNFYKSYDGPTKGGNGKLGDFGMNKYMPNIPKYIIFRNNISKILNPTKNDHKWVIDPKTRKYVNHFFIRKTKEFTDGNFSIVNDAKQTVGIP